MKNNYIFIKIITFILFINLISFKAFSAEQFNFNVTEIEILEKGNLIKGFNRGLVTSNHGVEIEADIFEYNKSSNILQASGNVKVIDKINNYTIFTENLKYLRNSEKIFANKNSKAIYKKDITIEGNIFEYDKLSNILIAIGDVKAIDRKKKL